jgi:hypothetical protein
LSLKKKLNSFFEKGLASEAEKAKKDNYSIFHEGRSEPKIPNLKNTQEKNSTSLFPP